ncbi:MAG: peptidylprolyl isomerase [Planctomycetota bacterium]
MRTARRVLLWSAVLVALPTLAQSENPLSGIHAHVRLISRYVPPNQPVWVQFVVENTTAEAITLTTPDSEPDLPSPDVGLPISHVFSGGGLSGVTVTTESGRPWDEPTGFRKPARAPILLLAPHSLVGTTLDLRDHFPALRGAGNYRIQWKPYGGGVSSEIVLLTIAPRKQVEITTDEGKFTIALFYDDAPEHVANFLDLATSGFYTGKTFHRIEPGYMAQGGCPRGDGTGIRLDGKRIRAELNSREQKKGSVSMALLNDDPDSGSCQFFVCNTRVKDWDGKYTVFGELDGDESFATLDRLMQTPADASGRPDRTLYMRSVRVLDAPVAPTPPSPSAGH